MVGSDGVKPQFKSLISLFGHAFMYVFPSSCPLSIYSIPQSMCLMLEKPTQYASIEEGAGLLW